MDANATEVTFNPQIASQSDAQDLPEGGFAAWATVVGAAMMQFSTFGYANAFGVFQGNYYTRTYLDKYTTSEIGWIGGTQFFLIYSCGVVTGPLFDAGYFRHVTIVGSLLNVFCMFMLSLARNNQYYQIFLCQGIGIGLSSGLIYIPALTISSRYFSRRRALTMGIIAAGGALGKHIV
ncbi:mycorrhiza-upregulated monocarboxylate permease [Fistulina hepatica ATCC 64428]|uniref:Mycorrhiza-upregulated monocarboxylate permease n=1 Tax=Fistulina hepatica ATCC 64428 TaxID=1128425 RepID=A0A0D7ACX3_9AGAR|nr:mycorrhiza-upregulated monocarboxylate permease [Fistulina hepatica ATCC 64428]